MRHPNYPQWIDFARGLVGAKPKAALERHLTAGCRRCNGWVRALLRVAETAEHERRVAPPDAALRTVQVAFRAAARARALAPPSSRFERTFDSGVLAVATGVRAGLGERRLVYETGSYSLELALVEADGSHPPELHGQLLRGDDSLDEVPVFLVRRGAIESSAVTGHGGLFELAGELESPCELWIYPDGRSCLAASWSGGKRSD